MKKLTADFFERDVLAVAPDMIGKLLVRQFDDGTVERFRIVEVEAYRGPEDLACHASKGRTKRTEVMFHKGAKLYVYLIYGMYQMLNVVTGKEDEPQAVLIRGVEGISGPGRLTKRILIDSTFNAENVPSQRLWFEDDGCTIPYKTTPRIGIDYAGEWKHKLWRFVAE